MAPKAPGAEAPVTADVRVAVAIIGVVAAADRDQAVRTKTDLKEAQIITVFVIHDVDLPFEAAVFVHLQLHGLEIQLAVDGGQIGQEPAGHSAGNRRRFLPGRIGLAGIRDGQVLPTRSTFQNGWSDKVGDTERPRLKLVRRLACCILRRIFW